MTLLLYSALLSSGSISLITSAVMSNHNNSQSFKIGCELDTFHNPSFKIFIIVMRGRCYDACFICEGIEAGRF